MAFSARTEQLGEDAYGVSFTGRLDLHDAARCHRELCDLIEAGARELVVDLSGTTVVDSTSIGIFIVAENALEARGGRLSLTANDTETLAQLRAAGLRQVDDRRWRDDAAA